ncbi:hypothetical protein PTSG_00928 [Salpingoeca rosetta]|uniref:Major facilitator superfamily (MFS) profile domain-containing protein n=1 Tax=Salpingoeca rosetta (strain ATCC 50818 / BSB-021) TaxID=946362 RepID=F2TXW6_SALR5|nr:uncharacterized protein PTSG_00928 [Salpingoeca rosetta]EGD76225.1 hypothetical protein PTSG_00928 [Salpingoeca rosetta]|eukprot:XP_004998400.1 hypothetical protein PTSG_00928 [Salpingoeca rosetta]
MEQVSLLDNQTPEQGPTSPDIQDTRIDEDDGDNDGDDLGDHDAEQRAPTHITLTDAPVGESEDHIVNNNSSSGSGDSSSNNNNNGSSSSPSSSTRSDSTSSSTRAANGALNEHKTGNGKPTNDGLNGNGNGKHIMNHAKPGATFGDSDDEDESRPVFDMDDPTIKLAQDLSAGRFNDDGETIVSLPEAIDKIGYGRQQLRVLLICGLCFCTDSIEVGLLTFLQVEARNYFDLTDVEESTLTAVVFAGELLGAVFWGPFADRCGRKRGSFFPALLVTVAGLASAFSVDYYMLVTLRFIVGVGIGGMGVPFDLLAEFMPPSIRGKALISIEFFWTFGTLFVNGLAWIMLDDLGWRYLVGFCSVPVALAMLSFPFLPESPHWLLMMNRHDEALETIRKAAKINKRQDALPARMRLVLSHEPQPEDGKTYEIADSTALLPGTVEDVPTASEVSPLMLFDKNNRMATITLWIAWASFGFTYYGTVIIAPEFFEGGSGGSANSTANNGTSGNATGGNGTHINNDSNFDYPALFTTGAAEVLGAIVAFLLVERFNRRPLAGISYLASGVAMMLMMIKVPRGLGVLLLVFARMSIFIGSCVTWVVTPELYATYVRAAGHSWSNGMARLAAFATPYWGDARAVPIALRLLLYGLVSVLASLGSFFLPRETRGMILD